MSGEGRLFVIGLGPGPAAWLSPEASAALARVTDLVGYAPYVERAAPASGARRTRATTASNSTAPATPFSLPRRAGRSASSRAAIPGSSRWRQPCWRRWRPARKTGARLDVEVLPGITAMHAAAARLGAPLGGDFCAISLSDNLKPWSIVELRLEAACRADFAIAIYNPASRARPTQIHDAFRLLRALRAPQTPVAFARAVGRDDERIVLTTVGEADPGLADMSTLVLIGASTTRFVPRPGRAPFLLTPRSYGAER